MSEQVITVPCKKRTIYRDEESLDSSAGLMMFSGCGCNINCFLRLCQGNYNYVRGIEIIRNCQKQTSELSTTERREALRKILISIATARDLYRNTYKYFIDYENERYYVCRKTFQLCYDFSEYAIKRVKREMREGWNGCNSFRVSAVVSNSTLSEVNLLLEKSGIDDLDRREIVNNMKAPHTDRSSKMYAWMANHFSRMGDHVPNAAGEIHLEPTEKREIHKEYCVTIGDSMPLKYSQFCKMWRKSFAHIKIRPYKNVPGKCELCLKVSMLRKSSQDAERRMNATQLHALHKSMYMAERKAYYDRMYQAKSFPQEFVGLISDGMAQNHCRLPHLANQVEFSSPLPQHLQGIIDSGKEFVVYRSFHTVHLTCDPAIYTLLLQLETHVSPVTGNLPDTVYFQIDGGSENANKYMLAVCELLIIRRLCVKIVWTRLPVGHTHENIDAKFGVIWTAARNKTILTPDEYKNMIISSCSKKGQKTRVVDVHIVPDFKAYFNDEDCIDRAFGNWAKNEATQLQFIFEAVNRCDRFPLGVKTSHRAYSCDQVVEIREDPTTALGFKPFLLNVGTLPEGGMHILTKLPTQPLREAPFKAGARETLEKTVDCFEATLGSTSASSLAEWHRFKGICPNDDIAANHRHMMPIPFGSRLFSSEPLPPDTRVFLPPQSGTVPTFNGQQLQQQRTGASVRHRGNRTAEPPRINI